jgi:hypothetical protein
MRLDSIYMHLELMICREVTTSSRAGTSRLVDGYMRRRGGVWRTFPRTCWWQLVASPDHDERKELLTPFRRRQSLKRTGGGALWSGADGPRLGAGRSAAWCEAAVLSGRTRTVRGTGPDGPRPGAGARSPCLTAGRSAL